MSNWDSEFDQLTISDAQIELFLSSGKWLKINKKETAVLEKPSIDGHQMASVKGL